MAILIPAGINPVVLVLVATAGSLLGNSLNYAIGFFRYKLVNYGLLKFLRQ